MAKDSFISSQLRESAPYLVDAGFSQTAKLLLAAADEMEMLYSLLQQTMPADFDLDRYRANENGVAGKRPERKAG